MLIQSLLQDKDQESPRRSRQASLLRASTVNVRDYRASGIEFQRFTIKKSLREGPVKRNLLSASAIVQEVPVVTRHDSDDINDIINDFQKKDRMEASGISLHSIDEHNSLISSTSYDGDLFYDVKESPDYGRSDSLIANEKSQMPSPMMKVSEIHSVVEKMNINASLTNKASKSGKVGGGQRLKKLFMRNKMMKKKQVIKVPLGQQISQFFGEGINSLILTLSQRVISVLTINLFFDVLFRLAVLLYCTKCFLEGVNKKNSEASTTIFLFPIAAMIFCRGVFFMTLIKMSFDEKKSVCNKFQLCTGDKTRSEMEQDRLFMRQYKKSRIIRTIFRSMIPPELWFWQVQNANQKSQIYFLINMIFKGIEIVFLLGTMLIVLIKAKQMDNHLRLTGFGIMVEEIIRYVINYLIINTLSK